MKTWLIARFALTPLGLTYEGCRAALQYYLDQIDCLLLIVDEDRSREREKIRAQNLLNKLKDELEADCHLRDTTKGNAKMSRAERAFLFPALQQSAACLNIRRNSKPDLTWPENLSEIRLNFTFALSQM